MVKTIVVLGAGLAGLPLAHYITGKIAPNHGDLKVILVSPNEEFYWNLASVRFAVDSKLIPEDKYFFSIRNEFAKYPKGKFEFVAGKAEALDPDRNSVTVQLNDGGSRTIEYHTVIIATGNRSREDMPWKGLSTSPETRAAVARLQTAIKSAKSIVVAGAGVTGVEFAGELGSEFAKNGKKQVTIISMQSLPLESRIMERTRKTAKEELEKLKVKFIGGARVTAVRTAGDGPKGQNEIELAKDDGTTQTIRADLVIPTYGAIPNTEFVPEGLKDSQGLVKQDKYLRVPGHGNTFVVGDAGNLQPSQAVYVDPQLRHLMKNFDSYLRTGDIAEYAHDKDKITLALTVGRDRGTGQIGTMKPFSWLIWMLKGRHLGTDKSAEYASGLKGSNGAWP